MKPVNKSIKIIYLLIVFFILTAQESTQKDTLANKEILKNKHILKHQMAFQENMENTLHSVRLNDLHRPKFFSINNIPFHLLNAKFMGFNLGNRLSGLIDYNNIYYELIDSIRVQNNSITFYNSPIDNYQPVTNLIIDEGDFLYSYVDAFIKRRTSENFAFFIGIRNIESIASYDNELENPQFKTSINYNFNDHIDVQSSYFINAMNYRDIGMTEISDAGAIYQVSEYYYRKHSFDRQWFNTLNWNDYTFKYRYQDYFERKSISIDEINNEINVFDHEISISKKLSDELMTGSKLLSSHGNYFNQHINQKKINLFASYDVDIYKFRGNIDLVNTTSDKYVQITNEYDFNAQIYLDFIDFEAQIMSKIPNYNMLFYNRSSDLFLNPTIVTQYDYGFYLNKVLINKNMMNEKIINIGANKKINDWKLKLNYHSILDRVSYNSTDSMYVNGENSNILSMEYSSKYRINKYIGLQWNGYSNLINTNSLYPDHFLRFEVKSNFTFFKNLNTTLRLGTDIILNQHLNHYTNYINHFEPDVTESVSYVHPYVQAKFSILDMDLSIEVRDPFKVNSAMNKGYKSFAYGTTFKILWSFYD